MRLVDPECLHQLPDCVCLGHPVISVRWVLLGIGEIISIGCADTIRFERAHLSSSPGSTPSAAAIRIMA